LDLPTLLSHTFIPTHVQERKPSAARKQSAAAASRAAGKENAVARSFSSQPTQRAAVNSALLSAASSSSSSSKMSTLSQTPESDSAFQAAMALAAFSCRPQVQALPMNLAMNTDNAVRPALSSLSTMATMAMPGMGGPAGGYYVFVPAPLQQ
jgi:hypothetical protein